MEYKLKCPCVNWYPEAFASGTRKMTDEEVGIYIRALNNQFIEGGIEPDEYREFPKAVQKKFKRKGNLYINERMQMETDRKRKYSKSRSNNRNYHGRTKEEWEAMSLEERTEIATKSSDI